MTTQRLDYTSSNDTNVRNDENAISPYSDGERVVSSVVNRPVEVERLRSEVIRTAIEELKYLADTNIKWAITGGNSGGIGGVLPCITSWEPDVVPGPPVERGVFTIDSDIVLQPINTVTGDTTGNTFDWDFDDEIPNTDTITFGVQSAPMLASIGADILELEIEYTAAPNVLTLTKYFGTKIQRIKITVSGDGTKTVFDLITALSGDSDFTDRFSLVCLTPQATKIYNPALPPPPPATGGPTAGIYTNSEKSFEREMHLVQVATLASFFAASNFNKLGDGDTLAIYFPYMTDPNAFLEPGVGTTSGRRQACVANANVTVGVPSLVNLGREPDKLPYCVPICKRIGTGLFFVDGTFVESAFAITDPSIYFGENGHTLGRYAADSGASEIGVAANAGTGVSAIQWDIAAGTLQAALEDLQAILNDKASLNEDETITGGTDNQITLDKAFVALREDFADVDWHLVYRNNGKGKGNTSDDVGWRTLSIYENVGTVPGRAIVIGGVLDGSDITSSNAGGTGYIAFMMTVANVMRSGMCFGIATDTTRDITDSADWDIWEQWRQIGGDFVRIVKATRQEFESDVQVAGATTLNGVLTTNEKILAKGTSTKAPITIDSHNSDPSVDNAQGDIWVKIREIKVDLPDHDGAGRQTHLLNPLKAYGVARLHETPAPPEGLPGSFNIYQSEITVAKVLKITFLTAMASVNYVVLLTIGEAGGGTFVGYPRVRAQAADYFIIDLYDIPNDALIDMDSAAVENLDIHFAVIGLMHTTMPSPP